MSPSQRDPSRRYRRVDERRRSVLDELGPGPFRTADALAAGLTASDLRSDAVQVLRRGVYADARWPLDLPMQCAGLLLGQAPEVRVAAFTAAALLALPVPHRDQVYLAYPQRPRRVPCGVVDIRPDLTYPAQVRRFHGLSLPLSHPGSIVAECARDIGLVDGVVLADAVLAQQSGAAVALREAWLSTKRNRALTEIARLARDGVESPMKTRLRLLLVLSGLPEPVVQHGVIISGRQRRFDLAYPDVRIAVEYDGSYHYTEAQKHADIVRAQEAASEGWEVIKVVSYGVYREPQVTVAQVEYALRRRGVRCLVRPGWQRYFPGAPRR